MQWGSPCCVGEGLAYASRGAGAPGTFSAQGVNLVVRVVLAGVSSGLVALVMEHRHPCNALDPHPTPPHPLHPPPHHPQGYDEQPIHFLPTFKLVPHAEPKQYNMQRVPSWTDRILHKASSGPRCTLRPLYYKWVRRAGPVCGTPKPPEPLIESD